MVATSYRKEYCYSQQLKTHFRNQTEILKFKYSKIFNTNIPVSVQSGGSHLSFKYSESISGQLSPGARVGWEDTPSEPRGDTVRYLLLIYGLSIWP